MIRKLHITNSDQSKIKTSVILFLFTLFFVFPSSNFHVFSGLPFNHQFEFAFLLLLLPFIASSKLRRLYGTFLISKNAIFLRILLLAWVIGLCLKILILGSSVNEGFWACYQSISAPLEESKCERSYEIQAYKENITRFEKKIDFTSHRRGLPTSVAGSREFNIENWHLSFLNSNRFNYSSNVEGNIWRGRLPFSVQWYGEMDNPKDQILAISYTGEGQITLGDKIIVLPPSYFEENTLRLQVGKGEYTIEIFYKFDDGYRVGDSNVPGPYARLRLYYPSIGEGNADTLLIASRPNLNWRFAGGLVDLCIVMIALSFLPIYLFQLRRHSIIFIVLGILIAITLKYEWLVIKGISQIYQFIFILILLAFILYIRVTKKRGKLLTAFVVFVILAFLKVFSDVGDLNQVIYHSAGDDWLTYESFARDILETKSLAGGEDIFYYQPINRYIKFTEHIILGDGDGLPSIATFAILNYAIFYFFYSIIGKESCFKWRGAMLLIIELLLFILMNSEISKFIYKDASEVPTWIFLPSILALLFLNKKNTVNWEIGVFLLGLSAITRINHLPAVLFIFSVFVLRLERTTKAVFKYSAILLVVLLLPLAHNVYYGGQAVLFTSSYLIPSNLDMPPEHLIKSVYDINLRTLLLDRLGDIFYFSELSSNFNKIIFHGLQSMWVVVIISCIISWRQVSWDSKLLLSLPLLYLGIHLIYQVNVYYPRHIVVGHMAMGLVAAYMMHPKNFSKVVPHTDNLI